MRMGFFNFVDRVGDTFFRREGENVSTSEVPEAITAFPGMLDANVYGVRSISTIPSSGLLCGRPPALRSHSGVQSTPVARCAGRAVTRVELFYSQQRWIGAFA